MQQQLTAHVIKDVYVCLCGWQCVQSRALVLDSNSSSACAWVIAKFEVGGVLVNLGGGARVLTVLRADCQSVPGEFSLSDLRASTEDSEV